MSSSVAGGPGGSTCGSRVGGPCGACRFLRRRCISDCIFAPYFDQDQGAVDFAAVHKVFGASNVSRMLNNIPMEKRADVVTTFCYEAHARLLDPVYGCFSNIFILQQQILRLQSEVNHLQNHLAAMEQKSQVPFPAQHPMPSPGPFPVSNLPAVSNIETNMDINLSCLIDEQASQQPHQKQYVHMRAHARGTVGTSTGGDSGDLYDLARDIMNRNAQVAIPEPPPPRTHQ